MAIASVVIVPRALGRADRGQHRDSGYGGGQRRAGGELEASMHMDLLLVAGRRHLYGH